MNASHRAHWRRIGLWLFWWCGGLAIVLPAFAQNPANTERPEAKKEDQLPQPQLALTDKDVKADPTIESSLPQPPPPILPGPETVNAVDLGCVLHLAGVNNPDILIARQRIATAVAMRLFAYAQALPNLNAGGNYDDHNGPVQQSDGNILNVNRQALYVGAGAAAVAAGTVTVPGVLWAGNPGAGVFGMLAARQLVRVRQFESLAVRNQIFLRVADAYMELLRAESHRAIAVQNREDAHDIARLMLASARRGRGRAADSNRANSEYLLRINDVVEAEKNMLVASARLAKLLNLPPSVQLHGIDGWVVPTPLVPQQASLSTLLLFAINQRPELAARRAAIRVATDQLRAAQVMPLSPTVWAGFSAGTFGGGSNLVAQPGGFGGFQAPYFGNFAPRDDVDVILYWTAQNMGVGNWAQIRMRLSERQIANLELIRDLNVVRNDVARAYAGIHARWAQIDIARDTVLIAQKGYEEDYERIKSTEKGLPIELLNNFKLLVQGRHTYLDSVVDYDESQFSLFVALGQPPADMLAKAIPSDMPKGLVPPPAPAPPLPGCGSANDCTAACTNCRKNP
ncbi:MAG TPA: TolC family protein [Gemmataceae bacterium]|nr:TolC family protein [Gemmataceae bacterium]